MARDAWYEKWFDENYLKLYGHRDKRDALEQIELILTKVPLNKDSSILDLACGEGRHCQLLFEKGYRPVGQDLSKTLIESGRKKHPYLDLRVGDMRDICGRYDLILSLFTSFGYFELSSENARMLKRIFDCLKKGKYFWLDFFNTAYLQKHLVPHTRLWVKGLGLVIEEREIKNHRINKKITIESELTTKTYLESVACYSEKELTEMIEVAGLRVLEVRGDYRGNPLTPNSPRAIFFCQKPEA